MNTGLCFPFILFKMATPRKRNMTTHGGKLTAIVQYLEANDADDFLNGLLKLSKFIDQAHDLFFRTKDNKKIKDFFTGVSGVLDIQCTFVCIYTFCLQFVLELDMCLWNTDAPGGNKVEIWQKSLSPIFWPRPTSRGMWCQRSVRNP